LTPAGSTIAEELACSWERELQKRAEKPSHKCGTSFPEKAFSMGIEWEERTGCQGLFVI
jgi:hypothetical protein